MSDIINTEKHRVLHLKEVKDAGDIAKICRALSSEGRVGVLRSLMYYPKSISALSEELRLPISNVSRYAEALAEAGLITISYQPGIKGHTKFCQAYLLSAHLDLSSAEDTETGEKDFVTEMPIGMFTSCNIFPPCGMNGADKPIETVDHVSSFFSPERVKAENLWFDRGFLGYDFPLPPSPKKTPSSISFSFEVCSETGGYNNNWQSDITVKINGKEVATFTSPGDFGGTRGKYTPAYWPVHCTQFGLLKKITVNSRGVFVDNTQLHQKLTFDDLDILGKSSVKFEVGVKDDSKYRGGINLFGRNFGDFQQAIVMTLK